ncbi:MAG: hypothetical protein OCD76_04855 [Reichenbachiella sp.]
MEDKALMEQLNVGEIVIITYAEAVVVQLDKKEVKEMKEEKPSKKKNK